MAGTRGRPPKGAGDDARKRILEAAIHLFSERGFAATPVSLVCERAGVGKPALYWHFGNKDGLLDAVLEAVNVSWIEELRSQTSGEGTPQERLERLTSEWKRMILERPHQLRLPMIALLEQGESSEATREAVLKVWRRAEKAIVDGIEQSLGGLPLAELELVAFVAVTLLQGVSLRHVVDPDEAHLDRMLLEVRRTMSLLIVDRLPPSIRDAVAGQMGGSLGAGLEGD